MHLNLAPSGPDEAFRPKGMPLGQPEGRQQAARRRHLQLHDDVEAVHDAAEPGDAVELLQDLPRLLLESSKRSYRHR